MAAQTLPPELREFELSEMSFWVRPDDHRMRAFAAMRRLDSAPFVPLQKFPLIKSKPGFYVLARHADVLAASRDPELFSSEPTTNSLTEMPAWAARFFGSMVNMDDPRHARIRRIVSRAFSPNSVPSLTADRSMSPAEMCGTT